MLLKVFSILQFKKYRDAEVFLIKYSVFKTYIDAKVFINIAFLRHLCSGVKVFFYQNCIFKTYSSIKFFLTKLSFKNVYLAVSDLSSGFQHHNFQE